VLGKPTICILTETYHPLTGGGETQARALAEGLVADGLPVTVLTRRWDASLQKIEHFGKIIVYRVPPIGPAHLKKWGLLLTSIPALIRLRRHYDLIFVSGFRVLGLCAVIVGKLLGKRCILKADSLGEMSGEFFAAGLEKWSLRPSSSPVRLLLGLRDIILRRATAFVAISSAIKTELMSHGVNTEAICMIPNSVDTSTFHPVTLSQKRKVRERLGLSLTDAIATFTGRLVSYKGLPLLLRAWEKIRRKHLNAKLLLVGSGGLDIHNCETELKDYVQSRGLQESIYFVGCVENVCEYLQASDVFVFPTENEAFGISLIEAMACGLPVISTLVGGVKDIVEHEKNGLVVNPGRLEELYDGLDALLTDRALGARLGQAARKSVEERYSTQVVIAKYLELFRTVAA
jgi:glycosyltransferase involved in cell wall biosynthesis